MLPSVYNNRGMLQTIQMVWIKTVTMVLAKVGFNWNYTDDTKYNKDSISEMPQPL